MKLKNLFFGLTLFLLEKIAPFGLYALSRSSRLQQLALRFLSEIPVFSRVKHMIQPTGAEHEQVVSEGKSSEWLTFKTRNEIKGLTVVVAIYNAHAALEECLDSLVPTLRPGDEVLLIDDCSTDPKIGVLLEKYKKYPNFKIIENKQNLGYTKTINKSFAMTAGRDVILLNSDTVVTRRWIENLSYLAYSKSKVATVTPMSDNSGAFSFPKINQSNNIPAGETANSYAAKVSRAGWGVNLQVPTGNGFCLYIRRDALDDVGAYDDSKYPRGYGEENDFCMRALHRGWLNLVSDKVFVYHKTSQSFGQEKEGLIKSGLDVLSRDYPEYSFLTTRFYDKEFTQVRNRISNNWNKSENGFPRVLFVLPIVGGGLPETNKDLIESLKGKISPIVAKFRGTNFEVYMIHEDGRQELLESVNLLRPISPVIHESNEYDRYFSDLIYRYSIDIVHIEHFAWQSTSLVQAAKSLGIATVTTVHDFYAICPSHNLLDQDQFKCKGVCSTTAGSCPTAIWPEHSLPKMKNAYVKTWQVKMGGLLEQMDGIVAPSKSAGEVLLGIYPNVGQELHVIPHGRDFVEMRPPRKFTNPGKKIKILFPGNLNEAKGLNLIRELSNFDKSQRFEFHFMGETPRSAIPGGAHHGPYERERFIELVAAIDADFGAVFSIWDETYCHTLTELWASGLLVFGLNNGAVAERINETNNGWVIESYDDAKQVFNFILSAIANEDESKEKIQSLRRWQNGENRVSLKEMGQEYLSLYRSTGNLD